MPWADGTVAAKIRGDRFRLFAWGPRNTGNSFAPFFYGRLEAGTSGTVIRGRFQLHRIVQAFLVVWFGGLIAGGGLVLFLPPTAWGRGQPLPPLAVLGPAGMLLLGLGFLRLCRRLARGQAESLRCFLARELQAQVRVRAGPKPKGGANG